MGKIDIRPIGGESMGRKVRHISEHDGMYAISFGHFVGIYKITRSLHYLASTKANSHSPLAEMKFLRSFENPLPVVSAHIFSCPLFSVLIHDAAHLRMYSINGQLINCMPACTSAIFRMRDADLNQAAVYH